MLQLIYVAISFSRCQCFKKLVSLNKLIFKSKENGNENFLMCEQFFKSIFCFACILFVLQHFSGSIFEHHYMASKSTFIILTCSCSCSILIVHNGICIFPTCYFYFLNKKVIISGCQVKCIWYRVASLRYQQKCLGMVSQDLSQIHPIIASSKFKTMS